MFVVRERIYAHPVRKSLVLLIFHFLNRVVNEVMWKYVQPARQATDDYNTTQKKMRFACVVTKKRIQTHPHNA